MKLSICIPTINRSAFISATLDSILVQLSDDCEVVILDGGSVDDTESVVAGYALRCERLRYFRREARNGFDQDCDHMVELARGEYCWFMADDDLLRPAAVKAVLNALRHGPSLVVVNVEGRNFSMSKILQQRWLDLESDRFYGPREMECLFIEAAPVLRYFASVVVDRALWLSRERKRYYGSWFTYLAVIFQRPLPNGAVVIAEPCISYRKGNTHGYTRQLGEIWFSKLPSVVQSLTTVSATAKNKFWKTAPWQDFEELLRVRALGVYSLAEYRDWVRPQLRSFQEALIPVFVAFLPGILLNAAYIFYYTMTRRRRGEWQPEMELASLKESRYHYRNWVFFRSAS